MEEEVKNENVIGIETIEAVARMFPKGEIAKEAEKRRGRPPKVKEEAQQQEVSKQVVAQEEQKKEVIETPFFKINVEKQSEQTNNGDVDFSKWENVVSFAKEEGFELNTPGDLMNVFKAIKEKDNKVKEYEPKIEEYANKIKLFEFMMNNAPADAVNPLLAWAKGEDYKAKIREVTETPFDITVDVSKHDTLELVNYFGEDKYSQDEWEDLDEKVQKNLLKSAKDLYKVKQNEVLEYRTKSQNQQIEKQNKFIKSVKDEVTRLKAKYPDMTEKDLKDVEASMMGGINKMLFNDDGTYKSGAADHIAMAVHGERTLGQMKDILTAKMKAETNKMLSGEREKILIQSNENANLGKAGDATKKLEDEIKNRTGFLKHIGKA